MVGAGEGGLHFVLVRSRLPLRVLQRSEAIKAAFSQTVGRHMEERNGWTKAEKYAELSGVVALKIYGSQD